MEVSWRHLAATAVRLSLAAVLAASHLRSTTPFVYPHYVVLILGHPWLLRRLNIRIAPWQTVWISCTLFIHPMGGLFGLYRSIWWFDHLTHAASATLVASIGNVIASVARSRVRVPRWTVPVSTIVFVMVAGLLWELLETYTPLLTVYGPNDTFWDVVFDFLGGVIASVLAPRLLGNVTAGLSSWMDRH